MRLSVFPGILRVRFVPVLNALDSVADRSRLTFCFCVLRLPLQDAKEMLTCLFENAILLPRFFVGLFLIQ
jgi:hypothetical protein